MGASCASRTPLGPRPIASHLAVVIPTYRRPVSVSCLIQSLLRGTAQPHSILVVNNDSSPDAHAQLASMLPSSVRLLRGGFGLNLSAARNLGWRSTSAPLILFLDDDNVVAPDTIRLLSEHRFGPCDAAIAPVSLIAGTDKVFCAGIRRSMWTTRTRGRTSLPVGLRHAGTALTEDMPNAFAMRRTALQAVAGFDSVGFPFHYSEADIFFRLRQVGYEPCRVLSNARVYHRTGTAHAIGTEYMRAYELGGATRVSDLVAARVTFHRRYSGTAGQRFVACRVAIPLYCLLVSAALLLHSKPRARVRPVALAMWHGLATGARR